MLLTLTPRQESEPQLSHTAQLFLCIFSPVKPQPPCSQRCGDIAVRSAALWPAGPGSTTGRSWGCPLLQQLEGVTDLLLEGREQRGMGSGHGVAALPHYLLQTLVERHRQQLISPFTLLCRKGDNESFSGTFTVLLTEKCLDRTKESNARLCFRDRQLQGFISFACQ